MPQTFEPNQKLFDSLSYFQLCRPVKTIASNAPPLISNGDRPLKMTFEDQLNALIFFHLEEHVSARHLIQTLKEDDFARENIAPEDGISRSSFSEAINSRGLEQLQYVFEKLSVHASDILPGKYTELGNLVAFDGSLIDAVLSMTWADYRKGSKKAKVHLGFNINHGIPQKIYLTKGKKGERPFVNQLIAHGQTGVGDRGYHKHELFDSLQAENKSFVIRIKANTSKTLLKANEVDTDSIVFHDAEVLLGSRQNNNQTRTPIRLIGYRVANVDYWVATNRRDLTAEQITKIYELRWKIENFFSWWKRHLRVYHLIARSKYGLMVQIMGGLITYLLLAIYCHDKYDEPVSIGRVRELRIQIRNELRNSRNSSYSTNIIKEQKRYRAKAKS